MAILKDTLIQGACRVIGDAYFNAIKSGVWNGTAIAVEYGGTGATTAAGARTNLGIGSVGTLNYGSDTTKYLRNDGSWLVPPNTTYKFTIGSTTKGDSTNGVDLGTLKSESASSGGTTLSLVTTGEKATWNAKTSNAGTVTKVSTGTGLTGGDITSTGTISINSTYQTYISHGESAYNSLSNYLPLTGGTMSNTDVVTNLNADLLDGINSTDFLRKVTVKNNEANDFNSFSSMTLTGRGDPTTGASLSNAPWSGAGPAGGYGTLTYLWSGYGIQLAFGYGSYRTYIRYKYYTNNAASWVGTWDSFALSSDLSSYYNKTTSDGRYVYKAGDTMTGALTVPSISVTGAATFSLAINGSILGNAATASRLLNARTISLTGKVTGSASFDGSGNISISTSGYIPGSAASDEYQVFGTYMSSNTLTYGWIDLKDEIHGIFKGSNYDRGTNTPLVVLAWGPRASSDYCSIEFKNSTSTLGWIGISLTYGPYFYDSGYRRLYHTGYKPTLDDVLDGSTRKLSNYALASSVYSPIFADGSNESGANNKKYYKITGVYPTTETVPVQYIITGDRGDSYLLVLGISKDGSDPTCDIIQLNQHYSVIDLFKYDSSNRIVYFKHDARSSMKYNLIEIRLISGPKQSLSITNITESVYNNSGTVLIIAQNYNSKNSYLHLQNLSSSSSIYVKIKGISSDLDPNSSNDDDKLYSIVVSKTQGLSGTYIVRYNYALSIFEVYALKAGGLLFKTDGTYLYLSTYAYVYSISIRLIGGPISNLSYEDITSSTFNEKTDVAVSTLYNSTNLDINNYTMHYSTTSNNNSSVLYIPDNVDGPNYCVDTIESSNSNTSFYYMWLYGLTNWTCYYNYMRHQLIINKKSVDVTVLMNVGHAYYAPATSFVIPAGYSIELSIYLHSQTDPMMITWSSPLRCPS